MAVLQMQRISICAMKKNRKAILEELQSLGVLEIDAAELDPELKTMDTMNARLIFEKNASLCDQAIEILDEFSKEKESMLASLAGKASDRKEAGGRSHPGSGRDPEDSQRDPGIPEEAHREQCSSC